MSQVSRKESKRHKEYQVNKKTDNTFKRNERYSRFQPVIMAPLDTKG
jgi:hypothetical protein